MRSIASPISSTMACSRCCTTETVTGSTSAKLVSSTVVMVGLTSHDAGVASWLRTGPGPHHRRFGPQRRRTVPIAAGRCVPFVPVVRDAAKWAAPARRVAGSDRSADACAHALRDATHASSAAPMPATPRAVIDAAPPDARLVFLGSTRKFTRWPDAHGNGVLAGEAAFLASGRSGVMLHPDDDLRRAGRGQRAAPRRPAAAAADRAAAGRRHARWCSRSTRTT